MRRAHKLKRNHSNQTVHEAVWVDTETRPADDNSLEQRHVLMFGWAAYRRRIRGGAWSEPDWIRFETAAELWDWLESKLHGKSRIYVFAHNWAFDAPVLDLFNALPDRGWQLGKAVIDSPPVILAHRRHPHSLLFIDTLNIWRLPLAKIGDQIGLPKLTMPPANAGRAKWDAYGKRDVEIIMAACLTWWAFLLDNDLGGFAPTLASQAFRTYRHRFMDHDILIDNDPRALALARSCYLGGRTECWHIGKLKGPLYQYDVNSMYPAVMANTMMPMRLLGYFSNFSIAELAKVLERRAVCASVLLHTNAPVYPVVQDGRLIFPVGRFRAHLSTPELVHALGHGHLYGVETVALYECALIFGRFIRELYAHRQAAQRGGRDVDSWSYKIMMNSLYGKFGQRGRVYENIDQTDDLTPEVWTEIDADTGTVHKLRRFGGVIQEERSEGEARDSHPAIAAHVTAAARMELWRLIQIAGTDNVYYMDTDSLLVNQAGSDRLQGEVNVDALGALKLEHIYQGVTLYGPKDYVMDHRCKIKGVRPAALWTGPNDIEQDRFSSLKGLLQRGDMTAPVVARIRKHLKREYRKGTVAADGSVSPFALDNW